MLVDLEWDSRYAQDQIDRGFLTKFEVTNGSLVTELTYSGEKHPLLAAKRIAPGVYHSFGLNHHMREYTCWEENPSYAFHHRLQRKFEAAPTEEEKDRIREMLRKNYTRSEYGIADNLRQVMEYGKQFCRTKDPYVLEMSPHEQEATEPTQSGFRWHKNGKYIGVHTNLGEYFGETPEIQLVYSFHFYRLVPRADTLRPEWRSSAAIALAEAMIESEQLDRLPVLADALTEAGCDNDFFLGLCRDENKRGPLLSYDLAEMVAKGRVS